MTLRNFRSFPTTLGLVLTIGLIQNVNAATTPPKSPPLKSEAVWSAKNKAGKSLLCTTNLRTKRNVGVVAFKVKGQGIQYWLASKVLASIRSTPSKANLNLAKKIKLLNLDCALASAPSAATPTPTPTVTGPTFTPTPLPTATALNNPPVAITSNVTSIENMGTAITLSASDSDGDTLSFRVITAPQYGTLSGTAPNLSYTKKEAYRHDLTADSISFGVSDGKAEAIGTINISMQLASGDFVGVESLAPYRDQLSEPECRYFVDKVLLGGSGETTVQDCLSLGLSGFVDSLLKKDVSTGTWNTTIAMAKDVNGYWNQTETRRAWMYLQIAGEDALRMRLAHIFRDHFAASPANYYGSSYEHQYARDYFTLTVNEAFDFESLVNTFINADALMGDWLNNNQNRKTSLNENFARELLELFTLRQIDHYTGVPNYTEDDVAAATKVVSGFKRSCALGTCTLTWSASDWWDGEKILFQGTPYEMRGNFAPTDMAALLLYGHPSAGNSVAYRLAGELTSPEISQTLVLELADDLRATHFKLRERFLPKLLKSSFMFSSNNHNECVRTPVQEVVRFFRTTQIPLGLPDYSILDNMVTYVSNSGEIPFEPRSVFGSQGCAVGRRTTEVAVGDNWVLMQQWLLNRQRGMASLLSRIALTYGSSVYDRFIPGPGSTGEDVVLNLEKILRVSLTSAERSRLVNDYMNRRKTGPTTYVSAPFQFETVARKRSKAAGAIEILSMHEQGRTF